jgi:hypothetical protein
MRSRNNDNSDQEILGRRSIGKSDSLITPTGDHPARLIDGRRAIELAKETNALVTKLNNIKFSQILYDQRLRVPVVSRR